MNSLRRQFVAHPGTCFKVSIHLSRLDLLFQSVSHCHSPFPPPVLCLPPRPSPSISCLIDLTGLSNDLVFDVFSRILNDIDHVLVGYVQILQSRVHKFTKARACSLQHFTHSVKQPYSPQRLNAYIPKTPLGTWLVVPNSPTSLDFDALHIKELFERTKHTSSRVQEGRTQRIEQDARMQVMVVRFVSGTL